MTSYIYKINRGQIQWLQTWKYNRLDDRCTDYTAAYGCCVLPRQSLGGDVMCHLWAFNYVRQRDCRDRMPDRKKKDTHASRSEHMLGGKRVKIKQWKQMWKWWGMPYQISECNCLEWIIYNYSIVLVSKRDHSTHFPGHVEIRLMRWVPSPGTANYMCVIKRKGKVRKFEEWVCGANGIAGCCYLFLSFHVSTPKFI